MLSDSCDRVTSIRQEFGTSNLPQLDHNASSLTAWFGGLLQMSTVLPVMPTLFISSALGSRRSPMRQHYAISHCQISSDIYHKLRENKEKSFFVYLSTAPILDFWGPYAEWGGGGLGGTCVVGMKEWIQRLCLCFTPSRIVIAGSAHLFHGSVSFQLFFFSRKRLYDIHINDFYRFLRRESVTAHHI